MSWYYGWRPYVSVAQKQVQAARQIAAMVKRGASVAPVVLESRRIARTFWGNAWCDNLEAYSDFENRLPRGRAYVRNGSVMDLQISEGRVSALVSGSELYKVQITIKPLAKSLWQTLQADCAGKIQSLLELLQGKLSDAVMQIVTRHNRGLFPAPKEISMKCSCPDWAGMCKHVAASLYGVGARLDQKPELLFLLRGVDPEDLIGKVSAAEAVRQTVSADTAAAIADADLSEVFGIDMAPASDVSPAPSNAKPRRASKSATRRKAAKKPAAKARHRAK